MIPPHFPSELEADYQVHMGLEKVRSAQWTSMLGALLFTVYGILDFWALPVLSAIKAVWMIRIAVLVLIFTVLLLIRFHQSVFISYYALIVGTEYLFAGLSIEGMMYLTHPTDRVWSTYYVGLVLICMAIYAWTFLQVKVTMPIGILLLVVYILVAIRNQDFSQAHEWSILILNCLLMISANIIGAVSQEMRMHCSRENYILQRSLQTKLEIASVERQQSEFLAKHDLLTGLPNRRYLLQRLNEMIAEANAKNATLAVLFLDLDGFKPINDIYGHKTGDRVLQILAARLKARIRRSDMVARLGGDEFVIALIAPATNLMMIVNRLTQEINLILSEPIEIPGTTLCVLASIGAAFYPYHGTTANALLSAADEQMYQAKRAGKNRLGASVLPVCTKEI